MLSIEVWALGTRRSRRRKGAAREARYDPPSTRNRLSLGSHPGARVAHGFDAIQDPVRSMGSEPHGRFGSTARLTGPAGSVAFVLVLVLAYFGTSVRTEEQHETLRLFVVQIRDGAGGNAAGMSHSRRS